MPQFEVTFTRDNDTEDGSAPQSHLIVPILAATEEGAIKKADLYWAEQNAFHGHRKDWTSSVKNLETDD